MGLIFAMFLKFYKGAFTYSEVMELPFNTFMMFYQYMGYLMNMETEEGQKKNAKEDKELERQLGLRTVDDDFDALRKLFG